MNTKPYYFFLLPLIFLLSSCSDEVVNEAKIEYTSSVEKLVEHTKEFIPTCPKIFSGDSVLKELDTYSHWWVLANMELLVIEKDSPIHKLVSET